MVVRTALDTSHDTGIDVSVIGNSLDIEACFHGFEGPDPSALDLF